MPTLRQRASSASAETRDLWPSISATIGQSYSVYYETTEPLPYLGPHANSQAWPRIAVVASSDPVDVALSMQTSDRLGRPKHVAVLNTANEKTPGGLWQGAVFAPEEALARRSNLVTALMTSDDGGSAPHHYPLPERGGLFSPRVTVIRGGPEQNYALWADSDWRSVSVISVSPVRRPKLDESGSSYSFPQERELQREKMRAVLRMAAYQGISDICLSPFGCGSYKNPVEEVCQIWKELLLGRGSEFEGWFRNVLFAVADGKGERNWEVFMRYFG
ncbi:hypothetical protein TWF481_012102 [Arthrobotrys musiformis]|uniref:Microbial-type PARG catalytic domain-containing protein n=1 Tax=Arthrobotrys musiformis TaxID=47236 RepID=A0AAV9W269_9PEZI